MSNYRTRSEVPLLRDDAASFGTNWQLILDSRKEELYEQAFIKLNELSSAVLRKSSVRSLVI